jgi:hypothetical protein
LHDNKLENRKTELFKIKKYAWMIEKQKERYDEEVAEEAERQRLAKKTRDEERDKKK